MIDLLPGVVQVRQNHVVVLETFGKFDKILEAGLHFINPFTSTLKNLSDWKGIASKGYSLMELSDQQYETNFCECNTKDKVTIQATSNIYFKIIDPYKAAYVVDVLPISIETICLNALKSQVGKYNFDDIFSKRREISLGITSELDAKTYEWGVQLLGVEVGRLRYDEKIHHALQEKRVEEAKKDADSIRQESQLKQCQMEAKKKEILARSKAETTLIEAKATAEANKILQKSEQEGLRDLVKQVGSQAAVQLQSASKAVAALTALSTSQSSVIAIPSDLKGIVNMLGLSKAATGM